LKDPSQRSSLDKAFQHPWLKSHKKSIYVLWKTNRVYLYIERTFSLFYLYR
jgi:hypothetical protein